MAKYDELTVYKASYDLLLEIFRFTKEFTREYKYTVGESLKKETLELITLIYRANTKTEKQQVAVILIILKSSILRLSFSYRCKAKQILDFPRRIN